MQATNIFINDKLLPIATYRGGVNPAWQRTLSTRGFISFNLVSGRFGVRTFRMVDLNADGG